MRTFLKGAFAGGIGAALVLAATAAVAGTGIGGIFNLGQTNTVNATSALSGASVGAQLQVTNSGTGSGAQGIGAFNNPVAATLYGRNSGGGPGSPAERTSEATASRVSAGAGASGVYGANTSANGFGVAGRSTGDAGIGVYGNNTAGGLGVFGKSIGGNGVQGTSAGAWQSGVYGENTSFGGYGVAGRSKGVSGIGVFGENTVGGWAGVFKGKVHLDGALDCSGCVTAGDITGKVSDSDKLDGIDSTGSASRGRKGTGPGCSYLTHREFVPGGPDGWLPTPVVLLPGQLASDRALRRHLYIYNDSGSVAHVFVESGTANPTYTQMDAGLTPIQLRASAFGDSFHIQAKGGWASSPSRWRRCTSRPTATRRRRRS